MLWEQDLDYICEKISKYMYLLLNLVGKVSFSTLKTAYHNLTLYAILWGHALLVGMSSHSEEEL